MQNYFYIGKNKVGKDSPCYVVAEIGSNHNQDFDTALKLIDAAKKAGVNAVKVQTFRASDHYSKKSPKFDYLKGQNTYELIKSLELDRSWQAKLKKHCEDQRIDFFSSPCDFDAVDGLEKINTLAYKLASFDLTDLTLLDYIAKTNKPVIFSTGMANFDEIERSVNVCKNVGNTKLAILQCTSLYPAPAKLSNLLAMNVLQEKYGCVVGYSDHTLGHHIVLASIAMNAKIVEKHFTLDRDQKGPDHKFASTPNEFSVMIDQIREIESAIGDGKKLGPWEEEKDMFLKGRRSIHAKKNIEKNGKLSYENLCCKRPGLGIEPYRISELIGKTVKVDIEEDQWITWDLLEK